MEGKICCRCKDEKDIDEFAFKSKIKGTRCAECKVCHRKIRNAFYANPDNKEKERLYVVNKRRREEVRTWIIELKSTLSCVQCNESRPATLHFHHKDPSQKELTISEAINRKWVKEKIQEEISKCEILCANCHAQEHFGYMYADVS